MPNLAVTYGSLAVPNLVVPYVHKLGSYTSGSLAVPNLAVPRAVVQHCHVRKFGCDSSGSVLSRI